MLKFTNQLTQTNFFLVRRQLGEGSCAALLVLRGGPARRYAQGPGQAHYAEQCPPPKDPPKSRKFLYGLIGATVLTGAAVVYAKNSPEARSWLENNVPLANDFIALVYQENTTYWKFSTKQLSKAKDSLTDFLFGKEGVTPPEFPQRSIQDLDKDAKKAFTKKEYQLPPPVLEPLYVEEPVIHTPEVEVPSTLVQTDKCEPQSEPPVKITKDIVELEQDMHENTKIAFDSYKKAMELCAEYNKSLFKVVESPLPELERKHFEALRGARAQRDALAAKAKEASAKARRAIDALDRLLAEGVQARPEQVAATRRYISRFRGDLAAAEEDFRRELDKQLIGDRYWNKVEEARQAYKEELEALFPGVDLAARRLELKGDTDLLLLYTLKQIQFLQNELAEIQTIREVKLNKALECRDEKAVIEEKIEDTLQRERIEKQKQFQMKCLEIEAEANKKMKEALKRQYEVQHAVMMDRIDKKEKEIMGQVTRRVSEQVEKERIEFKKELAAMVGKLQAIENTLKLRAKAEEEARRSQSLWAAAEALLAATRRLQPDTSVSTELQALEKAGQNDKLVQTVLQGIPEDTRKQGIATEKALRDRFDKLEKTATKVALIGREGASLPLYFLSWLQARLLFQRFAEIPQHERDDQPVDFTQLDTFDIMQRARYHMEQGELSHALRYVNLLQGAPRAAAAPWLSAARRHLEVRQAAETVMAHASLSALLHAQ